MITTLIEATLKTTVLARRGGRGREEQSHCELNTPKSNQFQKNLNDVLQAMFLEVSTETK